MTDYAESFLPLVRKNFDRDGLIHTIAAVMATKHPETGEKFPGVAALFIPMGDFPSKDIFADVVKIVAKRGEAQAVVLISETWLGESPDALKWHETHGTLEGCPGIKEAVMVSEERQGSYTSWRAYITRDASGGGTLGEFERLPTTREGAEGRFIGFMTPQA